MTYGDQSVYNRAVLLLLRQVREINASLAHDALIEGGRRSHRMANDRIEEIDALLDEIAALGARYVEMAEEGAHP